MAESNASNSNNLCRSFIGNISYQDFIEHIRQAQSTESKGGLDTMSIMEDLKPEMSSMSFPPFPRLLNAHRVFTERDIDMELDSMIDEIVHMRPAERNLRCAQFMNYLDNNSCIPGVRIVPTLKTESEPVSVATSQEYVVEVAEVTEGVDVNVMCMDDIQLAIETIKDETLPKKTEPDPAPTICTPVGEPVRTLPSAVYKKPVLKNKGKTSDTFRRIVKLYADEKKENSLLNAEWTPVSPCRVSKRRQLPNVTLPFAYDNTCHARLIKSEPSEPVVSSRSFPCPHRTCAKQYTSKNGLKYHLEHYHLSEKQQLEKEHKHRNPQFVCEYPYCPRKYVSKSGLSYHARSYDHRKLIRSMTSKIKIEGQPSIKQKDQTIFNPENQLSIEPLEQHQTSCMTGTSCLRNQKLEYPQISRSASKK